MTIGILQCGQPPEGLVEAHGTYGTMVRQFLEPGRAVRVFDVPGGGLPADAGACDAYVVSGSPAGVYDDLPWIPPLLQFLRAARGRAGLVGICFGHQAMAEAFGGAVVKSPKGWGIGLHRYDVRHRPGWMEADAPASLSLPASHQDQVVRAPAGARTVMASDFTPHAGLDYGDAISFQFHPEFSPAFARALLDRQRAQYGAATDAAIASYDRADDCARVRGWINRFLGTPAPGG